MRKVKIVCTIGPASRSRSIVEKMIRAGMNVSRLNFSHGTHEEHKKAVNTIRAAARKLNTSVAILQDLNGLKLRVGKIRDGSVELKKGSTPLLTSKKIIGDEKRISIPWARLTKDVKIGDRISMDDGIIQVGITGRKDSHLRTKVLRGGKLKEKKGVNMPGTKISDEAFTRKDREDLELGLNLGIDYVALSFVRTGDDVKKLKRWLHKKNADIPVIAKIENAQSLDNIEGIIRDSDGLMIARGDLGIEVPIENVPMIQKDLISKCNHAMKPVITATQMLESMTEHMSPTRAETTDVANAVMDGTDALMLSEETSVGKYPVQAVEMMDRIIGVTEQHQSGRIRHTSSPDGFTNALAEAACSSAEDTSSRAIVAFSRSGFTALLISKYRPSVPVIGFTVTEEVQRRMYLYWGIKPYVMEFPSNTDEMINVTERTLLRKRLAKKGDNLVIVSTSPFTLGGKTNILKLHRIGY